MASMGQHSLHSLLLTTIFHCNEHKLSTVS